MVPVRRWDAPRFQRAPKRSCLPCTAHTTRHPLSGLCSLRPIWRARMVSSQCKECSRSHGSGALAWAVPVVGPVVGPSGIPGCAGGGERGLRYAHLLTESAWRGIVRRAKPFGNTACNQFSGSCAQAARIGNALREVCEPGGKFVLPLLLLLQTMPCLAWLIFVLRREAPTKYKEVGSPLCQTIREKTN